MHVVLNRFPDGKAKALTMSYDDGVIYDETLIEIFNRYGIKSTFHLNAGLFGKRSWDRLPKERVHDLYQGHEISAHGFTHQRLTDLPDEVVAMEIIHDREELEAITGALIRGMSYPFGDTNEKVTSILSFLGIEYARVVQTTGTYAIPDELLQWKATCHHNDRLLERANDFISQMPYQMMLMYVWGHSFEFQNDGNWGMMECFCKNIGMRDDIWYATNIEVCDYIKALRSLRFSIQQDVVMNPSALDVWISIDGVSLKIESGKMVHL